MGACWSWLCSLPPHRQVKYSDSQPDVPSDDQVGIGAFHRSYDNRLWLFSRAWEPADKSKTWATLMIVHGTVDHSGVYAELGERLAAQGVAVFAADMRGWGRSDGEPLYFNSIETFSQDVLRDYARIHADGSPYAGVQSRFLLGKSLGGLITAWVASSHPSLWTGLIGLSGAYQLSAAQRPRIVLATLLRTAAAFAPKLACKRLFDPKLIVSDAAALRAWECDPLVSRGKVTLGYLVEILRASRELPGQLRGLSIPTLMLWGTGDEVVTEEGHRMMVEASGMEASQFIMYPAGFHNLLAEPFLRDGVISDIAAWLTKVSKRG